MFSLRPISLRIESNDKFYQRHLRHLKTHINLTGFITTIVNNFLQTKNTHIRRSFFNPNWLQVVHRSSLSLLGRTISKTLEHTLVMAIGR